MKILSLLVSDKVSIDDKTKKITIEGIFDSISASGFPAKHSELTVSAIVDGTPGKHHYKISIMDKDKEMVAIDEEISTGARHRIVARFINVIFPKPGIYKIKAVVDNEELSFDINLKLLK